MRLLRTSNLELQEFLGSNIPEYAILSHRWEEEEVIFLDLQDLESGKAFKKKGWSKIEACRAQGAKDGYEWVWIDSCCIDKSSSAELTEAINSMFNWYQKAQVCYTYMSDVPSTTDPDELHREASPFRLSKWFTRGWTLQELLAPWNLVFFSQNWDAIGTKTSLQSLLSSITGIENFNYFGQASIAQKMSWASRRETTRIEDRAYSLMGLFNVNMPPLYGEGNKAFLRLQLEIIKDSDDESIFAWIDSEDLSGGLLTHSPTAFQDAGDIERLAFDHETPPYNITNKGLRIESKLRSWDLNLREHIKPTEREPDKYLLLLQCRAREKEESEHLSIAVQRIRGDQYIRVHPGELFDCGYWTSVDLPMSLSFYVRQRDDDELSFRGPYHYPYTFSFSIKSVLEDGFQVSWQSSSNELRSAWEISKVGDEVVTLKIDRIPPEGITAGICFKLPGGGRGGYEDSSLQ